VPLLAACAFVLPLAAAAQETREAQIVAQQAAKAASLTPANLTPGERRFLAVKSYLMDPRGVFPAAGSVMGGGGFAIGPAYRYAFNDTTALTAKGLWSIRNYKQVDVDVTSHDLANGLLDLSWTAGWKDATQVAFYGIGMTPTPAGTSDEEHGRGDFRMRLTWASGDVRVHPSKVAFLGAGAAFEKYDISEGAGSHSSIEEVYTPLQAPGLDAAHNYIHTRASAGIDWRPAAGYARRGGLYAVTLRNYHDTDDRFTFSRVDADLVQHLPVMRETFVLSLRGRVQSTLGDDEVPFFLLPYLGSGDTLRGFASYRFRDRHSMLMSAEYRWTPSRAALDAAIFVDAGKVTSRREDLDFSRLKTNVGFGLRIHTPISTPLRIEVAKSNEGLRLVFGGSAAF